MQEPLSKQIVVKLVFDLYEANSEWDLRQGGIGIPKNSLPDQFVKNFARSLKTVSSLRAGRTQVTRLEARQNG